MKVLKFVQATLDVVQKKPRLIAGNLIDFHLVHGYWIRFFIRKGLGTVGQWDGWHQSLQQIYSVMWLFNSINSRRM